MKLLTEEQALELGFAIFEIPEGVFLEGPGFLLAYVGDDSCSEEYAIECATVEQCLRVFSDFVDFAYVVHPFPEAACNSK